ncbi:MAG: PTS sugar transporter subunit IIA [Myxococcales bacterium]|nr:PTS sugar transporter subunit IIA [Myxococcales bacterium]
MIGVVLCTHRSLAEALLDTAKMIVGDFPAAEAVAVQPGEGPVDILRKLKAAIEAVDAGDGALVLVDMFGGTPSNLALSLLSERVEVVTGVNLPMLLKLFTHREGTLADVAAVVRKHGCENILVAGALLGSGEG